MAEYDCFAYVYDRLMADAGYESRADYLLGLFKKFDRTPTLLLDLACGTGGFSNEFAAKGISVIAVDRSPEMLAVARENSASRGTDVLYLCQSAEELDLFGTVDGAVCCMDSINHITDYNSLCKALKRVALFLENGRLFIFDVNTVFKHKTVLSNNTFVIEQEDVFCVWQNSFDGQKLITTIDLDFFIKNGEYYIRSSESFCERAYTKEQLETALKAAGLEVVAIYGDMREESPADTEERIFYVTRKIKE